MMPLSADEQALIENEVRANVRESPPRQSDRVFDLAARIEACLQIFQAKDDQE